MATLLLGPLFLGLCPGELVFKLPVSDDKYLLSFFCGVEEFSIAESSTGGGGAPRAGSDNHSLLPTAIPFNVGVPICHTTWNVPYGVSGVVFTGKTRSRDDVLGARRVDDAGVVSGKAVI